jgi:hypothetical protein
VTLGIILRDPLDDILRGLLRLFRRARRMPEEFESETGRACPIPNLLWNLKTQFTGQENMQNNAQSHKSKL